MCRATPSATTSKLTTVCILTGVLIMCRRAALRSSLRITFVLLIGVALLPAPCVSMLVSAIGQGQGRRPQTGPPPRPGKPEGVFPDLDDVKNESSIEREPPAPIPS